MTYASIEQMFSIDLPGRPLELKIVCNGRRESDGKHA
jgi:hypothetical protein